MIHILSEYTPDGVYFRWRHDECGGLGGWTLVRETAELGGAIHEAGCVGHDESAPPGP